MSDSADGNCKPRPAEDDVTAKGAKAKGEAPPNDTALLNDAV